MSDFFSDLKRTGQVPTHTAITLKSRSEFPTALVGDVAYFIYTAAPMPTYEAAIVGALGLMAGICGRAYNVSNPPTGLNLYLLFLAPTGCGKDAMRRGYELLMQAVCNLDASGIPAAADFIGPRSLTSEPALIKQLQKTPSFVSVLSEFGKYLQTIVGPRAPEHAKSLQRILLDAWGLSGSADTLRPIIYSDTLKNTDPITSPALSLVCESTPTTLLKVLNDDLIADGLLPRFTLVDYNSDGSFYNEHAISVPSKELVAQLSEVCRHSLERAQKKKTIQVQLDDNATAMFRGWRKYAFDQVSGGTEVKRQLWNRAYQKALRVASLLAIGHSYFKPIITEEYAKFAIGLEGKSVTTIQRYYDNNEVGDLATSDFVQQKKVRVVIYDWFIKPWNELSTLKIGKDEMRDLDIVPWSYISKRLTADSVFGGKKATDNIKRIVAELTMRGELEKLPPGKVKEQFNSSATCYKVSDREQFFASFQR